LDYSLDLLSITIIAIIALQLRSWVKRWRDVIGRTKFNAVFFSDATDLNVGIAYTFARSVIYNCYYTQTNFMWTHKIL